MARLILRGFLQVSKLNDLETFLDRHVSSDLTATDVFLMDCLTSKVSVVATAAPLNCKSA
jgi:hypothetical protein